MKFEEVVGKTKEDILKSIDMNENEYLVKFVEQKGGLFKSASYKAFVYKLEDICQKQEENLEQDYYNEFIREFKRVYTIIKKYIEDYT